MHCIDLLVFVYAVTKRMFKVKNKSTRLKWLAWSCPVKLTGFSLENFYGNRGRGNFPKWMRESQFGNLRDGRRITNRIYIIPVRFACICSWNSVVNYCDNTRTFLCVLCMCIFILSYSVNPKCWVNILNLGSIDKR